MKYEWRKEEKEIYITKSKPQLCQIPPQSFLTIKGQGNPNSEAFAEKIKALYAVSYALKMMPRKGFEIEGYFDYTVYPLEGYWTLPDGYNKEGIDKDLLIFELMIKQPAFITEEWVTKAKELSEKKVEANLLEAVKFKEVEEGLCLQILHKGPFDTEPESFVKMADFCEKHQLTRLSMAHKEIYLSDFRRVTPDKYKTILRIPVSSEAKI